MKVSIIVPVYNVEKYLERCVNSLVNQGLDFNDYEILLVNDGSTDNSLPIANRLKEKYENIKVFTQENQGLSGARNTGLDKAIGDYVMFIDSDDYLKPNSISKLLKNVQEQDLDVCHFNLSVMKPDGSFIDDQLYRLQYETIYTGKQIIKDGQLIGSVCSNIYKRSVFEENGLRFTLGITHEDVEFTPRLFAQVRRVMIVDIAPYVYFYNNDSLSTAPSLEKRNKYICDTVLVVNKTRKFANEQMDSELKQILNARCNSSIIGTLWQMFKDNTIPLSIVKNFMSLAKQYGEYPVKGKTESWKSNCMKLVFNNARFYCLLFKFKRICH